jgi:diguanylate cyclase (GGDEF)-like protein
VNPDVEAHLRSIVNFPSPPGVAAHIIELARDPDIEMSKVAKPLSMDSALSTKILRIANSPLYAQRRKSENLRQALVVLGLNATLTLALSFTLVKSLRAGKANGLSYPLYWRRALLAATAGRALADALRHPAAEEIFLAALLQDVGMLALDQCLPELYRGLPAQDDHAAVAELELGRLQISHAEVGGWLMKNWNLPERLHRAIARSHAVHCATSSDPDEVFDRCVALSGAVADLFLVEAGQRRFPDAALAAERSLGLDTMAFGQVLGTIGAMIPETEALFEAEALAAQRPEAILEQAREVLMLRSLQALREISTLRTVAENSDARTRELEEIIRRDALTGVYNRAHVEDLLTHAFDDAVRYEQCLSVACVDLDAGPDGGDGALKAAARILRCHTRESDSIARHDGERFVIVLPATDAVTAATVCERIVAAFRAAPPAVASGAPPTVSVGYATQGHAPGPFNSPDDLLQAAQAALGSARMRGRNCSIGFEAVPLAAPVRVAR